MNNGHRTWPWTPEQYPEMPDRVRDNEQSIDFLRSDMDSIKAWLKAGVWGIWLLLIQVTAEWLGSGVL